MRTVRSITLAQNSQDTKFVTRNQSPVALPEVAKTSQAKNSFSGVLGSRSNSETTKVTNDILIADKIDSDVKSNKKEFEKINGETASSVADASMTGVGNFSGGLPAGTSVTDIVVRNMLVDVIENVVVDIDPFRTNKMLNRVYRDMFQHDHVCGSAVYLMSTLPFSDFSLTGLKDEKTAQIFMDSMESISIGKLLPTISIDHMTVGAALMSFTFSESEKKMVGVTPHDIDYGYFTQVPVFNIDPTISIELPPHILTSLQNPIIREKYKEYMPPEFQKIMEGTKETKFDLDPKTTIFIPRRGMLRDYRGSSLYKRALPAWFYEKALIKGTLDQVYKRQRATTHITVGDGDEWVPSSEEMSMISNLFLSADLDPLGAVVVTRNGVNVNEVRRGDDFWRWDQNVDVIQGIKLKAMGVSEAFLSADATYSNAEQALSVFMDQIRDYRAEMTREIFYEKMFPIISYENGITKQRYGIKKDREFASMGTTRIYRDEDGILSVDIGSNYPPVKEFAASTDEKIDLTKYLIPDVVWHKRLMPEADNDYLAMLGTLDEKGLPITIKTWAAAGGMKLDKLMEGLSEDVKNREIIAEFRRKIMDINKEAGVSGEEGEDGQQGSAGLENMEFSNYLLKKALKVGSNIPKSLLSRGDPGNPLSEHTDYDSQGNRRVLTKQGRGIITNRFNKTIAAAAAELGRQENARNKAEAPEPKKKFYHTKD